MLSERPSLWLQGGHLGEGWDLLGDLMVLVISACQGHEIWCVLDLRGHEAVQVTQI